MPELRIGTSGWSYKEWEGVFYPEGEKNKLSYYAKYFGTAEIDSTFYAFPTKGTIFGCARYIPDDFRFAAKLPRLITHDKRLEVEKGVKQDLYRFLDLMKPLTDRKKLGPLLIQLPPSSNYDNDIDRLKGFLEVIPSDVKFAIEFRHRSWMRGETWDLLRVSNVANTIVDEPLLPPTPVVTADFSFIRWHGHGARPWYNYRYSDKELEPWVEKVEGVAARTKEVYGYFNNHFHGFAIENSLKMLSMLGASTKAQDELLRRVSLNIDSKKAGQ